MMTLKVETKNRLDNIMNNTQNLSKTDLMINKELLVRIERLKDLNFCIGYMYGRLDEIHTLEIMIKYTEL